MDKAIKSLKRQIQKPEPEGELSTGFIDKRTNIWYNVNRKTNKYRQ